MRLRLLAIVVVALLLSGSATAYAAWSRGAAVGSGPALQSGTFAVTTTWAVPLNLTAAAPGSVRTGVLSVARTGNGRWVYSLGTPVAAGGTVRVFPTASCSGATLALPWSQTTIQAGTATAQHCVEFTAATPLTAGQALSVSIPVSAENRSTN
ncbi:hypothetical protein [Cellulomonas sp. Root137]|uniref:hypothetical protein n=1 Tax=Cellulomonas sp. Root137 TaxID=1736459 RepID=UPI000700C8C1|nr:hypothetical protein [Cellulomonas sp. Root137]KQY47172.1 hypothetical protein ASD18_07345 [Cellulomonas sp. Root137]